MKSIRLGLQRVAPRIFITSDSETIKIWDKSNSVYFLRVYCCCSLPWCKEVKWDEYVSVISNFK